MFNIILENNKQIEEMIKQLDEKILKLRANNQIPSEYRTSLTEIYQEAVIPWTNQYHMLNREIEPEREQQVQDKIYNVFLLLQALED